MIKFIVAALWLLAVTVGVLFYSFNAAETSPSGEKPAVTLGGLDYIKTEVVSVPVLKNASIDGYFLGRFVYTADPEKLKKIKIPVDSLIVDQVYTYLYGNPLIDFSQVKAMDLDAFRTGIRDTINERLGDKVIHEVLVEQLDYLSKAEIRDNSLRRRISSEEQPAAPAEASGGHGEAPAPSSH